MPLQPAYTWSETGSSIKISIDNVPIKDKGQLFCSDHVVKLNVPPYLLLLDLKHAVDEDRSTATITRGRKVVVNLVKAEPGPWNKLTAEGDAVAIRQQREESVQRAHQKLLAAQLAKQARKQQEERAAVDLQIQQQKAQRDQLEALKQQELQQERQELQQWQQHLEPGDESDYEDDTGAADADAAIITSAATQQDAAQHSDADAPYHGKGWWPSKAAQDSQAAADAAGGCSAGDRAGQPDHTEAHQTNCRISCNSGSSSSSSSVPGELVALTAAPACSSMLLDTPAADAGAGSEPWISASSTRRLAEAAPAEGGSDSSSNSSRTVCQLQTITVPKSSSSGRQVNPVAPVRSRAAPVQVTFTQLETPHLPAREQREVEIKQIKRAASKSDSMDVADRQPAFLKDKGDAFAAQGNYMGAINAYSEALELDPKQAALWANRAAAHLALGQAAECVQDCSTAIGLVEQAAAALQAAPGPATERELQAGMLGAAAVPDTAAAAAATPAAVQAEAAGSDADTATAAEGASASGCTTAGQQQDAAAVAADEATTSTRGSSSDGSGSSGGSDSTAADNRAGPDAGKQAQQGGSMAAKLQQVVAKLLARRAAAHVELQQLQEAADDLQRALRLDPGNLTLQADALEVSLARDPARSSSDPAALKQLGAARFKAGDLQGAAEAFTALADLLRQAQPGTGEDQADQAANRQHQQQQQLLLAGALSNRAACWLGLNQHECVQDCWAAFEALWPDSAGSNDESGVVGGEQKVAESSSSSGGAVSRLQRHPPDALLRATCAATAQCAARAVARMAAAYVCLKAVPAADAAFDWAAACWQLLGEHGRVAAIQADQQQLRQQQQQGG